MKWMKIPGDERQEENVGWTCPRLAGTGSLPFWATCSKRRRKVSWDCSTGDPGPGENSSFYMAFWVPLSLLMYNLQKVIYAHFK